VVRETFAVRYLQAGGKREALQELLGLGDVAAVSRYERQYDQRIGNEKRKELAEDHVPRQRQGSHTGPIYAKLSYSAK
jgi:site-specific recombinase XerD